jgi:hypothetical protein
MPFDRSLWPHNPNSLIVDSEVNWREVPSFSNWPVNLIRQLPREALQRLTEMNLHDKLDTASQEVIRKVLDGKPLDDEVSVLSIQSLTTLADANLRAETARAGINITSILSIMSTAINNGFLSGTQLTARDKIDLLKWMGNKCLPDMKAIEQHEVVARVDRGRKRSSEFTVDDLKSLSKAELLDLLE